MRKGAEGENMDPRFYLNYRGMFFVSLYANLNHEQFNDTCEIFSSYCQCVVPVASMANTEFMVIFPCL